MLFVLQATNWYHFAYSRFTYSYFAYLLPLSANLPTAKCDSNKVKQLKQAVQVYEVKGIVQKEIKVNLSGSMSRNSSHIILN